MPKQTLQVTTFSGGLNCYSDARDIEDNQFVQNWNAAVDKVGVIRTGGMGADSIYTEAIDNVNFQDGHGLFQFSTDYGKLVIDGTFTNGFKTGTLSAYASGTPSVTLETSVAAQATDYYKDWIIFIYSGPGTGESRKITTSSSAGPPVLTVNATFATAPTNASKYIIYRWTPSSGWYGDGSASKDFINVDSTFSNSIFTKSATISSNQSKYMEYIEYEPTLKITPGVSYKLSFDCRAKDRWWHIVSDGHENPITSVTTHGEMVPYVTLDSSTVTDTIRSLETISDTSIVPSSAWTTDTTYRSIAQSGTSGTGSGAIFDIVTDSSDGDPVVFYFTENRGSGYVVGDTITFSEPNASGKTATITVASINPSGLSLRALTTHDASTSYWIPQKFQNGQIGHANYGYTKHPNHNYINNGDFRTIITTEWTATNVTAAIESDTDRSYDGTAASCRLSAASYSSGIATFLTNYLTQTVVLEGGETYTLRFLYASTREHNGTNYNCLMLQIVDGSGEQLDIHQYFATHNLGNSGSEPSTGPVYKMETVTFTVPQSSVTLSTTENRASVNIRFTPYHAATSTEAPVTLIHGVTLTKNFYNLSSMSSGDKPYTSDMLQWNTYSCIFKLPSNYTEVAGWSLKLHAGNYSFRSGNDLQNGSATNDYQEVYFDNIRLEVDSEGGDTITLLTDNRSDECRIASNSSFNANFWDTNFMTWPQTKARPVYDYINGMLKICDSNFDNQENLEQFMYYSNISIYEGIDEKGWVKQDYSVPRPPSSVKAQEITFGFYLQDPFDCVPYLNNYFEGLNYRDKSIVGEVDPDESGKYSSTSDAGTDATYYTNWAMDAFGPDHHHGLVIRYFSDKNAQVPCLGYKYEVEGYFWEGSGNNSLMNYDNTEQGGNISGRQQGQLYDTSTEWFDDNIGNPLSQDGLEEKYGRWGIEGANGTVSSSSLATNNEGGTLVSDNIQLTRLGLNPASRSEGASLGSQDLGMYGVAPYFYEWEHEREKVHNPLYMAIESSAFDGFDTNGIAYIDIEFTWESFFQTGHNWWYAPIPGFEFSAGKSIDIDSVALKERLIKGEQIDFDTEAVDGSYGYQESLFGTGTWSNSYTGGTWDSNGSGYCKVGNLASGPDGFNATFGGGDWGYQAWTQCTGCGANQRGSGSVAEGWDNGDMSQAFIDIKDRLTFEPGELLTESNVLIKLAEITPQPSDVSNYWYSDHALRVYMGDNAQYNTGLHFWGFQEYAKHAEHFPGFTSSNNLADEEHPEIVDSPIPSIYQRFIINKLEIGFYNHEYDESQLDLVLQGDVGVTFNWEFPEVETAVGWGERKFKLASTSLSIFGEESALVESDTELNGIGPAGISAGEAPEIHVKMNISRLHDKFLDKTKFYMRDTESDIWFLQFYINHRDGRMYSSTSSLQSYATGISNAGSGINALVSWTLERENFKNFNEVNSYEMETMVSQDDAKSNSSLTCKYKASVVANNRLYVGNISQGGSTFGDRMLKSPIGKYNILPASNFIDVAINDGDEITALEYYKDKILQFKKRKLFVINTAGDSEFLEDTFENVGVFKQCSVAKTPHGIVWATQTGCYIYDGEKLTNLIDEKIPTFGHENLTENYWQTSSDKTHIPVVGYSQDRDSLLVKFKSITNAAATIPEGASYHFPTTSWTFNNVSFAGAPNQTKSGEISNMITNKEGDILYYRFNDASDTLAFNSIKKWAFKPTITASVGTPANKIFYFTTKDFTFGDIANRKKLYKVYVTYKVGTDGTDSGVAIKGAVNGSVNFTTTFSATRSKFAGTSTACYGSSTLDETDGIWKTAELKFSSPSQVNNIYSFQLQFSSANVANDFEINDISIVFRTKKVK